jgi:hypothetical protein
VPTPPGPDAAGIWDDARLQKLWLAVERNGWRSLAVVGVGGQVDTGHVAEVFARLAWRYSGQPSSVCDLRDLSMRLLDYQLNEIRDQIQSGMRLVIPLRPIFENPTTAPIAQHADATVLCIVLGETDLQGAEATVAAIGRERVIGSVLLPKVPR